VFKDDNISFLAYTLHLRTITSIAAVKMNREREREKLSERKYSLICFLQNMQ